MNNKVQKIREEVERLMYGFNLEADIASCEDAETEKIADIKYQLCKKILDYIDSLQKEPIIEDLDEAAREDAKVERSDDTEVGYNLDRYSGFISGAEWRLAQMMKKAISCEVWGEEPPHITYFPKNMKGHDKCKLIIIKED